MAREKLSTDDLHAWTKDHPGWTLAAQKIHRDFHFADFKTAFGFMTIAAIAIEKLDHHPEWTNVYDRVAVDLTTHDAGGVTRKDLELAAVLDGIAEKLS
jgi:4a-hydroxytetrahydrobiopterin dehydratase